MRARPRRSPSPATWARRAVAAGARGARAASAPSRASSSVKNLRAIATAACAMPPTAPTSSRAPRRRCGTSIEVLSGEKEAELVAQGIMMGFRDADGIAGDLGGGSLELIDVAKDKLDARPSTLPLGGLRLIDATGARIDKAHRHRRRAIGSVPWLARGHGAAPSMRSAAPGARSPTCTWSRRTIRCTSCTATRCRPRRRSTFCEECARPRSSPRMPGIEEHHQGRAARCCPTAPWCSKRLLKRLEPREVVLLRLRHPRRATVYSLLSEHERRKDPLLSLLRRVRARCAPARSSTPASCAPGPTPLFEPPGPKETPEERRLRHAACLLSDIGWRAHPDYRGEQSLILIAHAALAGIDHPGRVFLALPIYFRHVGTAASQSARRGRSPSASRRSSPRSVQKRARIVGAAIRAAHMLSIGRAGHHRRDAPDATRATSWC